MSVVEFKLMEPDLEELQALVDYHRTQQYEFARNEDYSDAQYHKERAQKWAQLLSQRSQRS